MTKPRLTLEEHTDLGRTLAGIRDELLHRATQIAHAYPRSGVEGAPYKRLQAALHELDIARTELDHALFREHPHTGETTIYYPHPEDRSMVRPPY
ncbi:hypothetical protein OID55_11000 [Streptomyces sp. NBC_00715]|uniref:hypothetical protein n=1 Tax=Streptomyces sp. NBC_00715 TaxID=2975811 RepID=UPI0038654C91